MKMILLALTTTIFCSGVAMAQDRDRDFDRDRGERHERDRGPENIPGAIIGGTVRALVGRDVNRDGDCRVIVERYRERDGDIVERRHRECD